MGHISLPVRAVREIGVRKLHVFAFLRAVSNNSCVINHSSNNEVKAFTKGKPWQLQLQSRTLVISMVRITLLKDCRLGLQRRSFLILPQR